MALRMKRWKQTKGRSKADGGGIQMCGIAMECSCCVHFRPNATAGCSISQNYARDLFGYSLSCFRRSRDD
jgi:hypothetical protein